MTTQKNTEPRAIQVNKVNIFCAGRPRAIQCKKTY
jgi:hypothetical protein